MTDAELVREAQHGAASAFDELFARWTGRLTLFCEHRGIAHELAEDLVQESMLRAQRSLGQLARPASFGAWVKGIALRVHRDWRKRRCTSEKAFTSLGPGFNADHLPCREVVGESAMYQRDDVEALQKEINRLPPEQQEVIRLYYTNTFTYKELAKMLGVSTATVNARLTKARQTLRERLKAQRRT